MKRTLIEKIPFAVPEEILRLTRGAKIYDSSCSPEASVYLIDKDGGYYLKLAKSGALGREAQMTEYFHSLGLGAKLLSFGTAEGRDYLLTARVRGEDCTDREYLSSPTRLCDTIATVLRALHEYDYTGCPVMNRTGEYVALARENFEADNYDKSHFPDSFGYRCAEEAIAALDEGAHLLRSDTLIHGDFCLPNIMLHDWRLSGFIDVGAGGVGDRHIDLFWGAWTLGFNLGTDKYRDRFFDAYGRDKVDQDALRVVAAAEVFG